MNETEYRPAEERPQGGPGTTCKVLLDAATVSLYSSNAFRVLGLPITATPRQILKHGERIKQMEELGIVEGNARSGFSLTQAPSAETIREALQRIKDPEKRLIDEFFWFWPDTFPTPTPDAAILAAESGDADSALKIWSLRESTHREGGIATHNLAIAWHLRALDLEPLASDPRRRNTVRAELEQCWSEALKRWKQVAANNTLWEKLAERVSQTDQAQITSGFLYRMRQSLPRAIGKINGELALGNVSAGESDWATRHVNYLRDGSSDERDAERTAELVLTSATQRLKQQIVRAKERAKANPEEDIHAAHELAGLAVVARPTFDTLYPSNSGLKRELFGELAEACNRLVVQAVRRSSHDSEGLAILRLVEPLAVGTEFHKQVTENASALETRIRSQRGSMAFDSSQKTSTTNTQSGTRPPPLPNETVVARALRTHLGESTEQAVIQMLKSIEARSLPAGEKMTYASTLLSKLQQALASIPPNADAWWSLSAAGANLLRAITLQALQQGDLATAQQANELAFRFAKDPNLWNDLKADRCSVDKAVSRAQAGRTPAKEGGGSCVGAVVAGVVLICLGIFGSSRKDSSSRNPTYSTERSMLDQGSPDPSPIQMQERKLSRLSSQLSVLSNEVWHELRETRTLTSVEEGLLNAKLAEFERLSNRVQLDVRTYDKMLNEEKVLSEMMKLKTSR